MIEKIALSGSTSTDSAAKNGEQIESNRMEE
jgi:hypothetical protein